MRIAQFTSSLIEPLGGAEQYCLALAREEAHAGHDVTVLTGWADASVIDALAVDGIDVVVIPSNRPYTPDRQGGSFAAKVEFHGRELLDSVHRTSVTRTLEALDFDVVHVHRFAGFGTAVLRVRNAHVVHTAHDFSLIDTSASLVRDGVVLEHPSAVQRLRRSLATRGLSSSTSLVFPSARTRDRHDEWELDTDDYDSHVIPHGWPLPTPQAKIGPTDGCVNFLFLGKLADHKGLPLLLEAWGDGIPGAVLRVAGDGPLASVVEAAAASNESIEALGWLDETARTTEFARADILVFPSEWPENFPIVVAESMLAGVPVVTTTIASPPLVDDGESGVLVEPVASSLRGALVALVADEARRAKLAAGAAERAAQLDMGVHLEAILSVYRNELDPELSAGPASIAS